MPRYLRPLAIIGGLLGGLLGGFIIACWILLPVFILKISLRLEEISESLKK